jgi:hypothetical protein
MVLANRVTVHHEGAGSPTDNVDRYLSTDKYSAGIGVTRYELRRSPQDSFRTDGQGGTVCLQICLSGNRNDHAVTDDDLELIARCCNEARGKGWLTEVPEVFFHNDTASTACPGTHTAARRPDIEAACRTYTEHGPVPIEEDDMPTGAQMLAVTPSGAGYWVVGSDGGVFCYGDAGFYGSCGDKTLNEPVVGIAATPSGRGYWLLAKDGGVFAFGDADFYGAPTGKIQ